jgi:hypothetical protein
MPPSLSMQGPVLLRRSPVTDAAYFSEVFERAQQLMDLYDGLDYEAALSRARIELVRRQG